MFRLTVLLVAAAALGGCERSHLDRPTPALGGDPERGRVLIARIGCGKCHVIPGIAGAHGLVGPPLDHLARRTVLAGYFPNTPINLVHWIQAPQQFLPGNAMPNMEINDHDAKDVAAYLYTLR